MFFLYLALSCLKQHKPVFPLLSSMLQQLHNFPLPLKHSCLLNRELHFCCTSTAAFPCIKMLQPCMAHPIKRQQCNVGLAGHKPESRRAATSSGWCQAKKHGQGLACYKQLMHIEIGFFFFCSEGDAFLGPVNTMTWPVCT